jgi:hypothetical protein
MRGKPSILSKKTHDRKRAEAKAEAEAAFRSGGLPKSPPIELKGMPAGRRAWVKLLRAHEQLPGELYNALDRECLIGFCQSVQARQRALELEEEIRKRFEDGRGELEDLLRVRAELRMATRLVVDMQKQLFATPKSRGGVNPESRELTPEEVVERELGDLDKLLGRSR